MDELRRPISARYRRPDPFQQAMFNKQVTTSSIEENDNLRDNSLIELDMPRKT